MSILSYKIRKNASIYGIPKVFFCCHPKDFDAFFDEISNEILAKQNCSIWHHGNQPIKYTDEILDNLSQMHLFVIPVTRRFLKEGNPALEMEFRFAVEHSIPILPLMQESGLENEFNQRCGNIQYLDKYSNDSTCIEYTDKLEKFLASVLLGDELVKKIRDAFDAYIFLSYRKKDRRYAQALMKLIHQNEFCRDIAIWYDEFLVPGENFNEAISEALKKSKLFLLTVTPNLVNETNYIMDVEFPMAKQEGKPILPCEMVNTDKKLLAEKFKDLPECADGHNSLVLSESLRRHFLNIATQERDSSPEHLFFIGLAYLNGIDVEVNREYAQKLITAAAEQDLIEAIEQLLTMYTNGIGVKIDTDKVRYWQKKLLSVTKRNYQQDRKFSTALAYIGAHFRLAQFNYDQHLYEDAMELANELKTICNLVFSEVDCTELEIMNLHRHTALADLLLGRTYHATSRFELAKKHYEKSSTVYEWLNNKLEDTYLLRDTAVLYNYIAQLCKVSAEYGEALRYYEKALRFQQRNAKRNGGEEHLLDQVLTQVRMSEIKRLSWDCEGAKQSCLTALETLDDLAEACGSRQHLTLKMLTLLALAESYRVVGDLPGALRVYDDIIPVEEHFLQQYDESCMDVRVSRLAKTVQIYYTMGDYESVLQYGQQVLALLDGTSLMLDSNIATGGTERASLYMFIGLSYYGAKNDIKNGIKYLKLAVEIADQYMEQKILCNIPDAILIYSACGDLLQLNGDMHEAGSYLERAVQIYENNISSTEVFRDISCGFVLYMTLGKNQMSKGEIGFATDTLIKAEGLYHKAISLPFGGQDAMRRDYAQLCSLIGSCYTENDDPRAKEYYLKCMDIYDQIPEEEYTLSDWNTKGIISYQLYHLTRGIFKSRKWKKRLLDAAYKIRERFPAEYKLTFFYEALSETGIFQ